MQQIETLPGGTRVFTAPPHGLATDALLLADFTRFHRAHRVADFGSGCGILLLALYDAGLRGPAVGIEQDPAGAQLLQAAIEANEAHTLSALCADVRLWRSERPLDLIISNPPYFDTGQRAADPRRAAARHEDTLTLDELCAAAARSLKQGGRLSLCWPARRLGTLMATLSAYELAPKRLQLVRKTAETPPWLCLMEARRGGGEGLSILPDRLLPPGGPVQY